MSYASSFRAPASLRRLLYIQINYQNWFSRASTFRLPMSPYLKSTNHEQKHVPGKILKKCMKGQRIQSCYQIYIKIHLRFDKLNQISEWFSDLIWLFSSRIFTQQIFSKSFSLSNKRSNSFELWIDCFLQYIFCRKSMTE